MKANNEIILQDVFFHLTNLKSDFARHKIENNKNRFSVYAMDDFTKQIELVEQIIKSYDNHNFKSLANKINSVLLSDTELNGINVIIKKENFLPQIDMSKIALIIHLI